MVRRVGFGARFIFAGGVAQNPCMCELLAKEIGMAVTVPPHPQTVGALGAALQAARELEGRSPA